MEGFGSREAFLSSFKDARDHDFSTAQNILDIIDSYRDKYVPFQIAEATKFFNTSMEISNKEISK